MEAIDRIPILKDDLKEFLDEVNPEIRRRIRAGGTRLNVNVSQHRLEKLQRLTGPSAKEFVECAHTGRSSFGAAPGRATDQLMNDVVGAAVVEFAFVFKGAPDTW
jgi:hypothetical protein